jgi:dTDP-4-amino-4,6-dideoxygalactose transaminase
MVSANRADLWDAKWAFKHHGKTLRWLSGATASRACGYGSNVRLTELQSAIGRIQLQRLPESAAACTRTALLLVEALADCPAERLPVARELGETSLMVLVHPTITPEQMAGYAEAVRSVVKRAFR